MAHTENSTSLPCTLRGGCGGDGCEAERKGGFLGQVTPWPSWQNVQDTERLGGPKHQESALPGPYTLPTATFSAKTPESLLLMEQAVTQRQTRGSSGDTPRWARDSD